MIPECVTKTCKCCNIQLRGCVQKRLDKTGLSDLVQKKIRKNKSRLWQISQSSISLKSEEDMFCQNVSDTECRIGCLRCKTLVRLYLDQSNGFAQFSRRRASFKRSISPKDKDLMFFDALPLQFRSFFTLFKENNFYLEQYHNVISSQDSSFSELFFEDGGSDNECEDDFNLMFSNECDPIVGSYTESLMTSQYVLTV